MFSLFGVVRGVRAWEFTGGGSRRASRRNIVIEVNRGPGGGKVGGLSGARSASRCRGQPPTRAPFVHTGDCNLVGLLGLRAGALEFTSRISRVMGFALHSVMLLVVIGLT